MEKRLYVYHIIIIIIGSTINEQQNKGEIKITNILLKFSGEVKKKQQQEQTYRNEQNLRDRRSVGGGGRRQEYYSQGVNRKIQKQNENLQVCRNIREWSTNNTHKAYQYVRRIFTLKWNQNRMMAQ